MSVGLRRARESKATRLPLAEIVADPDADPLSVSSLRSEDEHRLAGLEVAAEDVGDAVAVSLDQVGRRGREHDEPAVRGHRRLRGGAVRRASGPAERGADGAAGAQVAHVHVGDAVGVGARQRRIGHEGQEPAVARQRRRVRVRRHDRRCCDRCGRAGRGGDELGHDARRHRRCECSGPQACRTNRLTHDEHLTEHQGDAAAAAADGPHSLPRRSEIRSRWPKVPHVGYALLPSAGSTLRRPAWNLQEPRDAWIALFHPLLRHYTPIHAAHEDQGRRPVPRRQRRHRPPLDRPGRPRGHGRRLGPQGRRRLRGRPGGATATPPRLRSRAGWPARPATGSSAW